MAGKKKVKEKEEIKRKEQTDKDPYDEAMEIIDRYNEGNPPITGETED